MMMMQMSSDDSSRDVMAHMARNVTVWEFINMKVNRSLQRPNAKIRIADMLNELEELHRQYRKLARDELRPMPCDTDQPLPASKILVVSWRYVILLFYVLQHSCGSDIELTLWMAGWLFFLRFL